MRSCVLVDSVVLRLARKGLCMGRRRTVRVHVRRCKWTVKERAYTRRLVHIDPDAVNIETRVSAVERLEFAVPVVLDTWVEPVRKDGNTYIEGQ